MPHTILRLPAVKVRTGLSRSTIYLRIAEGSFPTPVSLGGRAVGWIDAEIDAWLAERVAASRERATQPGEKVMERGNTAQGARQEGTAKSIPLGPTAMASMEWGRRNAQDQSTPLFEQLKSNLNEAR